MKRRPSHDGNMTPALTSINSLRRLIPILEIGDDDARWLAARLRRYLADASRGLSLELALDLSPAPGQASWWTEEATQVRNAALRKMASRFWPDLDPGPQAREIERRVLRYHGTAWRLDRDRADMPERYAETEHEYLWCAFKAGAAMPIKRRQLETILSAEKRGAAA